jgi:dephospho-CoA kinase
MTQPKQIIIGLVGRKGSGKGTVASILKETYGASTYRFSDILREMLDLMFIEKSRENLVEISEIIRKSFGETVIKDALLRRMENDASPLIVLDGIRRLGDIEGLESRENFHLVSIFAPEETRYERMKARGENAGEASRSFESFLALENAPTERSIKDVETHADRVLDNSGDRDTLIRHIEDMMNELIKQA